MSDATVTTKGQVTIPAEIRKALAIEAGAKVVFTQLDDGTTVMRAKTRSIMDLKGMLKRTGARSRRKVAVDEMNISRR